MNVLSAIGTINSSYAIIGQSGLSSPNNVFATAAAMQVLSDSTADVNESGVGAHKLNIVGIKSDGAVAEETVNLNGTTPVATSNSYLVVMAIYVSKEGASGQQGTITLRTTSGSNTVFKIHSDYKTKQDAVMYNDSSVIVDKLLVTADLVDGDVMLIEIGANDGVKDVIVNSIVHTSRSCCNSYDVFGLELVGNIFVRAKLTSGAGDRTVSVALGYNPK